jgi:hypothetical protein
LGCELHERLPHHSSLTRIHDRFGITVFRQFFAAIVDRCIAAGLVAGRTLYLDSTPWRQMPHLTRSNPAGLRKRILQHGF